MQLRTDAGDLREVLGVLFDMDGTVVDSGAATERTWFAWAERHGVADGFEILHGQPAMATVAAALPEASPDVWRDLCAEQCRAEVADLEGVVAMPGALDLLAWLDAEGVPWTVVTSADRPLAEARLHAAGIFPGSMITWDDITHGKPHPEPFLRGADLLGLPIATCVVVEDAAAGVTAGLAAGAVTVALNGHQADVSIASLAHLQDLLRSSV